MLVLGVPPCNGLMEAKKPVLPCFHFPDEAGTLPIEGAAGMLGDIPTEAEGQAEPPGSSESLTGNPCAPSQDACLYQHGCIVTVHLYGPGAVLWIAFHLDISLLS